MSKKRKQDFYEESSIGPDPCKGRGVNTGTHPDSPYNTETLLALASWAQPLSRNLPQPKSTNKSKFVAFPQGKPNDCSQNVKKVRLPTRLNNSAVLSQFQSFQRRGWALCYNCLTDQLLPFPFLLPLPLTVVIPESISWTHTNLRVSESVFQET